MHIWMVESVQWREYSHLHLLNNGRLSAQVARHPAPFACSLPFHAANFLPGILNRLAKCTFLVSQDISCILSKEGTYSSIRVLAAGSNVSAIWTLRSHGSWQVPPPHLNISTGQKHLRLILWQRGHISSVSARSLFSNEHVIMVYVLNLTHPQSLWCHITR